MSVDIAVLRQKIHGQNAREYADLLRDRLPNYEVALASTPEEERELLTEATVAAGYQIDPDDLEVAKNLELFACAYAGTEHLPWMLSSATTWR